MQRGVSWGRGVLASCSGTVSARCMMVQVLLCLLLSTCICVIIYRCGDAEMIKAASASTWAKEGARKQEHSNSRQVLTNY